jgi:ABC-type nitrate/sulfonate/bicarbonate transport system ATPase subunit
MKSDNMLIEVKNLTKSFGDLLVLDEISFNVEKKEFLSVVGPTGCGKTTFLNSLTNLNDINGGEILFNGEQVDTRKHNISYVLQESSAMSWLTVEQNVRFGLDIKNTISKSEVDDRVNEMLKIVRMEEYRKYYPRQLSTSMLQRVVIARAFAIYPDLLLMDEPYGQLDLDLRYKLEDELLHLWERTKTTVIFITHNVEEAVYLGQRVMILTNKPAKVKEDVIVKLPHPRDIASSEFVKIRNYVTEQIRWW